MSSIIELLVLWTEDLGVVVECQIIEDLNCSFHAKRAHSETLSALINGLLVRHEEACLDEHLLKLKQVQVDVLVVLQELVLVVSLLQLLVLVSDVPYSSLHLDLHLLDIFGCFNQSLSTHLNLFKFLLPGSLLLDYTSGGTFALSLLIV